MKKINLAILWHMHQPPYLEPYSGSQMLPWAFLHGMKDYYDMGAVAAAHPRIRLNFNFTPSLLDQLTGYAADTIVDRTFEVMKKAPSAMTESDREYLFRTCFGLTDHMVERFPRYVELRALYRAAVAAGNPVPCLQPDEITDLTVLFLLAWCGPTLAAGRTFRTLAAKARSFTAADRDALLEEGRSLISRTGSLFRTLSEKGTVELSTTPGTHPILPLLCSSFAAVEARPNVSLPPTRFESPEEARRQIRAGITGFESFFGFKPAGMWPAEGSVSEHAVELFGESGIRWLATDEEILKRSLGGEMSPQDPLRPHSWENVSIFFRDHFLSDQIGFVYSRRPMDRAVAEFIAEMKIRAERSTSEKDIVVIALDGENAWEFYPDGGYPFLDELYSAIENCEFIKPTTFSEYLNAFGPGEPLDVLVSGSWIDGNFDTWIGDPVKNQAWDYLAAAYKASAETDLEPDVRERVLQHLLRAEASDWFWWFGHGHSSVHEKEFDYLFRRNVKAVYDEAGIVPPDYLDRPVGQGSTTAPIRQPTSFISPGITGRRDSYYKWLGAGTCEFSHGSIHRLQPIIKTVRFGFDRNCLYLMAEKFDGAGDILDNGAWIRIVFRRPVEITVLVSRNESGTFSISTIDASGDVRPIEGARAGAVDVFELALPLGVLGFNGDLGPRSVSFHIVAGRNELEEERFPWDSTVDLTWEPASFTMNNWFV